MNDLNMLLSCSGTTMSGECPPIGKAASLRLRRIELNPLRQKFCHADLVTDLWLKRSYMKDDPGGELQT